MPVVWLLDGCALRLCHRPVPIALSFCRSPFCRSPERLRRGRSLWFCRGVSGFSTSSRQRAVDLKHHTIRLRAALDSAWRAMSGTRAEILARFKAAKENPTLLSQAPPSAAQAPPSALAATPSKIEEVTGTAPPTAPQAPPSAHKAPPPALAPKETKIQGREYGVTKTAPPTPRQAPPTPLQATPTALASKATKVQVQESGVTIIAPPTASQAPPSAPASKATKVQEQKRGVAVIAPPTATQAPPQAPPTNQTAPLFHPGSFGAHLGETYDYLSHHINSYFSSFSKPHPDAAPPAASGPPAPPFSLGNYWSYSTPSVQAFVGSYIRPLVPRFRAEARAVSTEADEPAPEDGAAEGKGQSEVEDRARRLRLQREKIVARVSVDGRTRALVQALQRASDVRLCVRRVEELSQHLLEFPDTRAVAVKEQVIPRLLRLRRAADGPLRAAVRQALALLGFIQPVRNRGVRILSIDGGGTRGLLALQTLRRLQELSGKPIHQMFDYICGVSTGALLGFMLGVRRMPLQECEDLYRTLSSDVFRQNVIVGTVKMSWSHAFYDSQIWEQVLKEKMGSDLLIQTARSSACPKVAAVSTVVNHTPPVKAYVFRSYALPVAAVSTVVNHTPPVKAYVFRSYALPVAAVSTVVNHTPPVKAYVFRSYALPVGARSHYRGGCRHELWEALRASSAAPGYFQEFALGEDLHQDGGMLVNNPTALAIHECQCLWPDVPLQCVVSVGTGRFENTHTHTHTGSNSVSYTSLKTKLNNVISSATNTEEVHTMLDALLPPHTYFRFNPYLSEEVALDESRPEKLSQMQTEALQYLERNQQKLSRAVGKLSQGKGPVQSLMERLRLMALMYGL